MIWYCKKLYFPQISFFSLFSPFDFLPHLQTLWFLPPPPPGGNSKKSRPAFILLLLSNLDTFPASLFVILHLLLNLEQRLSSFSFLTHSWRAEGNIDEDHKDQHSSQRQFIDVQTMTKMETNQQSKLPRPSFYNLHKKIKEKGRFENNIFLYGWLCMYDGMKGRW